MLTEILLQDGKTQGSNIKACINPDFLLGRIEAKAIMTGLYNPTRNLSAKMANALAAFTT